MPQAHPRAALRDSSELLLRVEASPFGKAPYCIRMADESPFFLGGMWDVWHAREPDALFTFTVLTTFPNEESATVHDRMPVILQPKDHQRWLDPANEGIADLLVPYPAERMVAYPVSRESTARRTKDRGSSKGSGNDA